ncbi:uncharacterized protein LOC116055132 isoform X1 [Sander lucioperca]|uniref:uncharacterized protein LOC116055132 isoform X1 n=1 Tax=Sander lucioperca TaxID=283035 RepID=UPI00125D5C13|nr:uncharacterized protein LOC116055132 isoform X1 [Sander lucioperca]
MMYLNILYMKTASSSCLSYVQCAAPCVTFLAVDQTCHRCEFNRQWKSQPFIGSTPAGNIHLSAAVYFTGTSFIQMKKVFNAFGVRSMRYQAFRKHAKTYLEPAIVWKWKRAQQVELQSLSQQSKVIIGGDMRADSPGHCAKFGSYTVMNLETSTVIDIQLVQSNEVGGSYYMEKEGLKRSLALLEASGVTLDCIVTDRHLQIQKYLREKGYVNELIALTFESVVPDPAPFTEELQKITIPEDLCAEFSVPSMEEAIAGFVSRFNPAQVENQLRGASQSSGGPTTSTTVVQEGATAE